MDLDAVVFRWVNDGLGSERIDAVFAGVSEAGAAVIAALLIGLLARDGERTRKAAAIVLSVVVACAVAWVLKKVVAAPRPAMVLEGVRLVETFGAGTTSTRSWPSGHTTLAFALVVPYVIRCPRTAWLLIPAALIALSRVYVGAHFPTDVVGGALVGSLAGAVASVIVRESPVHEDGESVALSPSLVVLKIRP